MMVQVQVCVQGGAERGDVVVFGVGSLHVSRHQPLVVQDWPVRSPVN
jgi:hypothetical protein